MSIYKITFKYTPFGTLPDKHITADDVDCYSEIATFYNRIPQDNNFGGNVGGNYRQHTVAAFRDWASVEVVEDIPFDPTQPINSDESI